MAKRSRYNITSAFAWRYVRMNLPESEKYNPALPRVAKMRDDGDQACDEVTFMDGNRTVGPTQNLMKVATRQVASGVQKFGAQEAQGSAERSDSGMVTSGRWSTLTKISTESSLARRSGTRLETGCHG
jgi:hypothetical protein